MNRYQKEAEKLPSLSYISNSKIAAVLESPELFWARYFGGVKQKTTQAMEDGHMLHQAVLEPEVFRKNRTIHNFDSFRTKEAKMWREETLKFNPNALIMSKEEAQEVENIIEAVWAHEYAGKILAQAVTERHGYAEDPDLGLLYSRTDIHTAEGMIGDLKFVRSCNPSKFLNEQFNEGWYTQLAFYDHVDGLIHNRKNYGNRFYIAVEKNPPYIVRVFPLDKQFEKMGEIMWRKGAAKLKELLAIGGDGQRGVWFAESNSLTELTPKLWMLDSQPEFTDLISIGG
jgi:hypothetical protein